MRQKGISFKIQKIIVACDGCTDNTVEKVNSLHSKHIPITILEDDKRLGKMDRLNQIYALNTSEILITLDADLVLLGNNAIQNVLMAFADQNVVIAVFHQEPIPSDSFFGNVFRASDLFWIETRKYLNYGDHIQNLQGSATAMRKIVADHVHYPSWLNTDAEYLYVKAKKLGKFKYAYDAKAAYRAPDTFNDFWSIGSRAIFYRKKPLEVIEDKNNKTFKIPWKYKIMGIARTFWKFPLYTTFALFFNVLVRLLPKKNQEVKSKTWEMAQSARKAIKI